MPSVIFYNGEHCPHCKDNHKHSRKHNENPELCEFCKRIDADGEWRMTLSFYERAVQVGWKEVPMFPWVFYKEKEKKYE